MDVIIEVDVLVVLVVYFVVLNTVCCVSVSVVVMTVKLMFTVVGIAPNEDVDVAAAAHPRACFVETQSNRLLC